MSMSVLHEKRGISSCLLLWGDNGGREGKENRVEAMKEWLEGCKFSDVNSSSGPNSRIFSKINLPNAWVQVNILCLWVCVFVCEGM